MSPKLLPNPVKLSEVCNVEFASAFINMFLNIAPTSRLLINLGLVNDVSLPQLQES